MEQITESIGRYLEALDGADLQEGLGAEEKVARLMDKIAAMRAGLAELKEIEQRVHEAPDQQISVTDPDSREMATNMRERASSDTTCKPPSPPSIISLSRTR